MIFPNLNKTMVYYKTQYFEITFNRLVKMLVILYDKLEYDVQLDSSNND